MNSIGYTVRESRRAGRVGLRVSVSEGLVVTIPFGFDAAKIPGILHSKRRWLEGALARVEERRAFVASQRPAEPPDHMRLLAIGQEWSIGYRRTGARGATVAEESPGRLIVAGNIDDAASCRAALRLWLAHTAHGHLVPLLKELATEEGFKVGRVIVRLQRTRWGSCSKTGTISLNLKLLFLHPDVVRYVLLHELCHTLRMDHSAKFWAIARQHMPDCREHDKKLRAAWRLVPAWIYM